MSVTRRVRERPTTVKFYFSYRSPYAWLATLRLPRVLGDLPVDVCYRPVWEPEPALKARLAGKGMNWNFSQPSREKRRYIFQDIRRHVQSYGLQFTWPIDRDPHWSIPHIGFLYARDHGREEAYHHSILELRFRYGENIMDPRSVARVAYELGMDPEDIVRALEDGRYDNEVTRCFKEASDDDVFGWPFFVYGRQRFWGNDRLEWLAATLRSDHVPDSEREDVAPFAGTKLVGGAHG